MGTKTIVIMASMTMASVLLQKLLTSSGEVDKANLVNIATMGGLITTVAVHVASAIREVSKF